MKKAVMVFLTAVLFAGILPVSLAEGIICPVCGTEMPADSSFCLKCGTQIVWKPSEQVTLSEKWEEYEYILCEDIFSGEAFLLEPETVDALLFNGNLFALKKDGSITIRDTSDVIKGTKYRINNWADIIDFSASTKGLLAIKKNGTVLYDYHYGWGLEKTPEDIIPMTNRTDAIYAAKGSYERSSPSILFSDGTILFSKGVSGLWPSSLCVPGAVEIYTPKENQILTLMTNGDIKEFQYVDSKGNLTFDNRISNYWKDCGVIAHNVKKVVYDTYAWSIGILYNDGSVRKVDNYDQDFERNPEKYLKEKSILINRNDIVDIALDDNLHGIDVIALTSSGEIICLTGDLYETHCSFLANVKDMKALVYSQGENILALK